MLFDPPKMVGLIFDISLRHYEGHRIVDLAKRGVLQVVKTFEEDDGLYLFHPDCTDPAMNRGEQVCAVGNYDTDGYKFDLMYALKLTLYVVGAQDAGKKYVCLVTDRISADGVNTLARVETLNKKDDMGCELLVVGVGNSYARTALEAAGFRFLHCAPPEVGRAISVLIS